jgi:hypothetical protein
MQTEVSRREEIFAEKSSARGGSDLLETENKKDRLIALEFHTTFFCAG